MAGESINNLPWLTGPIPPKKPPKHFADASIYLAALKGLERTQYLTAEELRTHQFGKLSALILHAYRNVPYYKKVFIEKGIQPTCITQENWQNIPILTRSALQTNKIVSQVIPPQHGKIFENKTSGATGQPVRIYATELTNFYFQLFNIRDCLWHKRDVRGKHASIKFLPNIETSPEGLALPSWGYPIDVLFGVGPLFMLDIRYPIKHQLEWLAKHNPDYLLTYPSNLKALVEESLLTNVKIPNLKEIRTISEILSPETREFCSEAWNVSITDIYSSQEFGYIALKCPIYDHYHVQGENVLMEVLDKHGNPCRPGEIGRVILTSLTNYATPLIRYEIMDYAQVSHPCDCGRGLPTIKRVIGRQRNMLTLPSGEKRWPMLAWSKYPEVGPIRQFQFIQHTLTNIEMRLVSDVELDAEQRARLIMILQDALGYPFEIALTPMAMIPQGPNGKYEEFMSLLETPP